MVGFTWSARAHWKTQRISGRFSSIDHRPGTVRVIPHDWDGDGRLDFAALVSPHYESVEV